MIPRSRVQTTHACTINQLEPFAARERGLWEVGPRRRQAYSYVGG